MNKLLTLGLSLEDVIHDYKIVADSIIDDRTYQEADVGIVLSNLDDVIKWLEELRELQEQIPKWHLCEEELPTEATCYLCAVKHRFNKDDRWRWTVTDIVLFGTENNWIVDENKNEVIAWMELPKFEESEE